MQPSQELRKRFRDENIPLNYPKTLHAKVARPEECHMEQSYQLYCKTLYESISHHWIIQADFGQIQLLLQAPRYYLEQIVPLLLADENFLYQQFIDLNDSNFPSQIGSLIQFVTQLPQLLRTQATESIAAFVSNYLEKNVAP